MPPCWLSTPGPPLAVEIHQLIETSVDPVGKSASALGVERGDLARELGPRVPEADRRERLVPARLVVAALRRSDQVGDDGAFVVGELGGAHEGLTALIEPGEAMEHEHAPA